MKPNVDDLAQTWLFTPNPSTLTTCLSGDLPAVRASNTAEQADRPA